MRVLAWLKDHWKIPVLALLVIGAWVWSVYRRDRTIARDAGRALRRELDAIEAAKQARTVEAKLGAQKARETVEAVHAEALAKLDSDQRAEAITLASDPAALAKFLVKSAR